MTTLFLVRTTCERIGCGRVVAIVYGTVPSREGSPMLWVDAFDVETSASREREIMGYVCREHGERLSPPQGWHMDDRRESSPRLFRPQPTLHVVTAKASRSRKEKVRDLPRPSLFSDQAVSGPKTESPTDAVIETVENSEPVIEPVVAPEIETVESSEPAIEPVVAPEIEPVADDPSADATRPWKPFFDPDDDLDGMLNATGSMLRDAFRSRHNGRRND